MENNNSQMSLIIKLAEVLHQNGTSTPELERELMSICDVLNVRGSFLISPTSISLTLDSGNHIISQNLRVFPGAVNLNRLNKLKFLLNDLTSGKVNINEAHTLLDDINNESISYPFVAIAFSFSVVGACLAVFMQGKIFDIFSAFACGGLVAILSAIIKSPRLEPIKETIIAFFIAMAAFVINYFVSDVNVNIVTLSSLIILLPGLGLTIAISELANKHFVSGVARLVGAIVEFFKLGAGIVAAYQFASYFEVAIVNQPLVEYALYIKAIVILICSIGTSIVLNANLRDIPWIIAGALSSMLFLEFIGHFLSSNLSVFITSFFAGLISNLFALKFNKNSSTILLPSIIFLVPGVLGIKSLQLLVEHNFGVGLGSVANTFTIAILIVSGIFFADAIRPSYKISKL